MDRAPDGLVNPQCELNLRGSLFGPTAWKLLAVASTSSFALTRTSDACLTVENPSPMSAPDVALSNTDASKADAIASKLYAAMRDTDALTVDASLLDIARDGPT